MASEPEIHIGTSGWTQDSFGESFLANVPRASWLAHCAERFTGLEINGTFYRLQAAETFERWRDETPDGFRFAMKAHRYSTHSKLLKDPDDPIARSRDNAEALGDALRVVLWQLPERLRRDDARLERFLLALAEWPRDRWRERTRRAMTHTSKPRAQPGLRNTEDVHHVSAQTGRGGRA